MGAPRMDDARCGAWARDLGLVVVSVAYRLAPEHPFPAALDDAHGAWAWLQGSAGRWASTRRASPSGGRAPVGALAACLAQRLLDEGGTRPAAQLLVYPMLDDRTAARRELDDAGHLVWHNRSNRAGWRAYLGRHPGRRSSPPTPPPRAAPTCALCRRPGSASATSTSSVTRAARTRSAWSVPGSPWPAGRSAGAPHGFDVLAPDVALATAFAASHDAFLRKRLGIGDGEV
jgi:acetyl esterase/lipase